LLVAADLSDTDRFPTNETSRHQESSVKIDAYRSEIPADALERAGKAATASGKGDSKSSTPAAAGGSDELSLSSDARLMQTVMQSAQQALNIRQDVVERMRAAMANGKVGNDPHALADALLDRLIGPSVQKQS
jgi:flagellar biosynthesis anti-sigma factor FlgM